MKGFLRRIFRNKKQAESARVVVPVTNDQFDLDCERGYDESYEVSMMEACGDNLFPGLQDCFDAWGDFFLSEFNVIKTYEYDRRNKRVTFELAKKPEDLRVLRLTLDQMIQYQEVRIFESVALAIYDRSDWDWERRWDIQDIRGHQFRAAASGVHFGVVDLPKPELDQYGEYRHVEPDDPHRSTPEGFESISEQLKPFSLFDYHVLMHFAVDFNAQRLTIELAKSADDPVWIRLILSNAKHSGSIWADHRHGFVLHERRKQGWEIPWELSQPEDWGFSVSCDAVRFEIVESPPIYEPTP